MLLYTLIVGLILSTQAVAFDSFEHTAAGYSVKLKFPGEDQQKYKDDPFENYFKLIQKFEKYTGKIEYNPNYLVVKSDEEMQPEVVLGYGEIIALAGDFFGILDKTISSGKEEKLEITKKRFMEAFNTIIPSKGNKFYANNNLDYLRKLFGKEFKSLLDNINDPMGIHFHSASSHSVLNKLKSQADYSYSYGYTNILAINLDHFGEDAITSYTAGHRLALEQAKKAHELQENGNKKAALAALNYAYSIDAFAAHFLSDQFSAGHLRAPRRQLFEISKARVNQALGYTQANVGLMANAHHDEDGYVGLWVKNKRGDVWRLYGDGSFFDIKSEKNRDMIRECLQASVDEVWEVFESGEIVDDYKALDFVGVPLPAGPSNEEMANSYPLFKFSQSEWPSVRKSYYDNTDKYVPVRQFDGITSFFKSDLWLFDHGNIHSFLKEFHLVEPLQTPTNIYCYSKYDRESYWPSKAEDYTVLEDMLETIKINNRYIQLYKKVTQNLRANGTYYAVDKDEADEVFEKCQHALTIKHNLGSAEKSLETIDPVEIRAQERSNHYSHPLVYYDEKDEEGKLYRVRGYMDKSR